MHLQIQSDNKTFTTFAETHNKTFTTGLKRNIHYKHKQAPQQTHNLLHNYIITNFNDTGASTTFINIITIPKFTTVIL